MLPTEEAGVRQDTQKSRGVHLSPLKGDRQQRAATGTNQEAASERTGAGEVSTGATQTTAGVQVAGAVITGAAGEEAQVQAATAVWDPHDTLQEWSNSKT